MAVNRRFFLKSSGIAAVGVGTGAVSLPRFLVQAAEGTGGGNKVLVVLFQRGAADALNIVIPHAEKAYHGMRPTIGLGRPRPGQADSAIDLDGFFGLHPALAPFKSLYDQKSLAVIHATGSPHVTRSHFDAQDFMESGTPGIKSTPDGWLNRYLAAREIEHAGSFRAVSMTSQLPRVLSGPAPALAIPELSKFGIEGRYGKLARHGLASLYASSDDPLLSPTARETFEAIEFLERADPSQYRPAHGARYPKGQFGGTMLQIAQLIKAGVGLEIAFAEIGGWDHHVNEGAAAGPLANLLRQFARGIEAFVRDLDGRMQDVVLLTMSEFGRTVEENGNRGTDHGHAGAMFALGGAVRGGQVYGDWPGLRREQLHEGRDLALTTDFRDVIGEVLQRHLGARQLGSVFPSYHFDEERYRGILSA